MIHHTGKCCCDLLQHSVLEINSIRKKSHGKMNHLPNIKQKGEYIGPHTAKQVTENHIVIPKGELSSKRDKKVPIHIVRLYSYRNKVPKKNIEETKNECLYSY